MKRSEIILMVLQVPVDFFMLLLAGCVAYYIRFMHWAVVLKPVIFKTTFGDFMHIAALVGFLWLFIFALVGLYSTNPNRKLAGDLTRVVLACTTGLAAIAVYIMFSQQLFDSRFLVVAGWVCAIIFVSVGRILMRGLKGLLYRMGIGLRRVVIFGLDRIAHDVADTLKNRRELGYQIVGEFEHFDKTTAKKIIDLDINEIIFTNPRAHEKETLNAIEFSNQNHIIFKYSADLFSTYSSNMAVTALAGVPVVELRRTPLDGWGRVVKRIFDIVGSIVVIIITSPLTILSSIIILCETGRPIIYKNERVGIRGRKFFTYKFRSMCQKDCTGPQFGKQGVIAEKKERGLIEDKSVRQGPIYKIADDPRVTRFGRFLRRWSVDELPQFFNVLRNEMSIVGPRPHQPREVEKYESEYPTVFALKPGITGLSQISGRSDLSFEEEMKLDIFYIEKWSLLLDFIVFIKTPFIIFKKRKAL